MSIRSLRRVGLIDRAYAYLFLSWIVTDMWWDWSESCDYGPSARLQLTLRLCTDFCPLVFRGAQKEFGLHHGNFIDCYKAVISHAEVPGWQG